MPDLGLEVLFKGKNMIRLLGGLGVALKISATAVLISLPVGILLGVLMTLRNPLLKAVLRLYLEFIRIMPQMVLLFLVYFGSTRAFGWDLSGETASIIVFVLWGAAEMSDLVRGALIAIPRHQYESSAALGMSRVQTYWYIIIPQTVRRLIPLSINLITRMIKTTSLVLMIGVVEVLKVSQQIIEANRTASPNAAFGIYLTVFVLYFFACWHPTLKRNGSDLYGRTYFNGRTPDQGIWRDPGAGGYQLCGPARRGHRGGGTLRLRQKHPAAVSQRSGAYPERQSPAGQRDRRLRRQESDRTAPAHWHGVSEL